MDAKLEVAPLCIVDGVELYSNQTEWLRQSWKKNQKPAVLCNWLCANDANWCHAQTTIDANWQQLQRHFIHDYFWEELLCSIGRQRLECSLEYFSVGSYY